MAARKPEVRLTARQNARLRERVRALAQREGLSERALAARAGLSIGAVRSVGGTEAGPTLGTLLALARALGLHSVDQLLGPSALALMARQDQLETAVGEPAMNVVMSVDYVQPSVRLRQRGYQG
jgi:transcriptional regulator with XRE-family HTH domain